MTVADDRRYMAKKLWGGRLYGWSSMHWSLTRKDVAVLAYWQKHAHIEILEPGGNVVPADSVGQDLVQNPRKYMLRLTEAGKAALGEPSNTKNAIP